MVSKVAWGKFMIVSKSRQGDLAGEERTDLCTVFAEQERVMLLGTLVHEGELVPFSDLVRD